MSIKEKGGACFKIFVAGCALITTFYSAIDFMVFLSNPSANINKSHQAFNTDRSYWSHVCKTLFIDQLLLALFLLLHSILALPEVKQAIGSVLKGLEALQRSIYVILTSASLLYLVSKWQRVQGSEFWSIRTDDAPLFWWLFVTLHALAWVFIYVGMICMDVNELLGVKQVYYDIQRLPEPNTYKSSELKRLYLHMRHPSFIGFTIVLWLIPCMSLDRLLLATVFTIYMFLSWNTERHDCYYQKLQFVKKHHEFNHLR